MSKQAAINERTGRSRIGQHADALPIPRQDIRRKRTPATLGVKTRVRLGLLAAGAVAVFGSLVMLFVGVVTLFQTRRFQAEFEEIFIDVIKTVKADAGSKGKETEASS